jgi:Zn ribbon nucleic-acid-binding protein
MECPECKSTNTIDRYDEGDTYFECKECGHIVENGVEVRPCGFKMDKVKIKWLEYYDLEIGKSFEEGDMTDAIIHDMQHDVVDIEIDGETYQGVDRDAFEVITMTKVTLHIEYAPNNKFKLGFEVPDDIPDADIVFFLEKAQLLDHQEAKHVVFVEVE